MSLLHAKHLISSYERRRRERFIVRVTAIELGLASALLVAWAVYLAIGGAK